MLQRNVLLLVLDVEQHGVTLIEGTAPAVLSRQAHRNSRFYQAAKSQCFCHPVIDCPFTLRHLGALFQQLLHLGVDMKTGRITYQPFADLLQFLIIDGRFHFVLRFMGASIKFIPVPGQFPERRLLGQCSGFFLRCFILRPHRCGQCRRVVQAVVSSVDFPQRRVLLNRLVQQRLRHRWIIYFAVSMTPVANQVDHHVTRECVAIIQRDAADPHHCVYIFCIDVENRYVLSARGLR